MFHKHPMHKFNATSCNSFSVTASELCDPSYSQMWKFPPVKSWGISDFEFHIRNA